MSEKYILIVDDEAAQREALAGFLKKKNFTILQAESGEQALQVLQNNTIDLVLSDYRMPGLSGGELLEKVKAVNPNVDVIIMTAFGSIETAIDIMKNGALDFITKPVNLDYLLLTLEKAFEKKHLISENKRLQTLIDEKPSFKSVITSSSAMEEVLAKAYRAAKSKATILITGESGTGKELVARSVHLSSNISEKPFVAVNMAALSDNLVESELFGHEKGAFTGANELRKGRFEMADGGTIFIDEVGDIPLTTQVKLLRVLQEQTIERIGSSTPININVRVIAATHKCLEDMVQSGEFRQDLFYRLNVVKLHLPPLRERKSDISLLLNHFVARFSQLNGKEKVTISKEAMDAMLKYNYPGNIRELENIVEQAVVLCLDDVITTRDLPASLSFASFSEHDILDGTFTEKVEAFEKNLIRKAMQETNGVQTRAAELLGLTERNLRYKLEKYKMK